MKKIFLILILFLFLNVKVNADEYYTPQWSEFCPLKYLCVEYIDYKQLKPSQKLGYFFKSFISSENIIKTNNYWVERRNDFETEINFCNEIPKNTDKVSCYIQVGKIQREENKSFYEIQALQREASYERNRRLEYEYKQ